MFLYNKKNEDIFQQLTEEEQEEIEYVLDIKAVPLARGYTLKEINLVLDVFDDSEDGLFYTVKLEVHYDKFSILNKTFKYFIGESIIESVFNQFLFDDLEKEYEEISQSEVSTLFKTLILTNPSARERLDLLVQEDLIEYLDREDEFSSGIKYRIFELEITYGDYKEALENYVFENLDKYL